MQGTQIQSLGQEDPLEEELATHSSVLAGKNPMDRGAWQATVPGVTKSRTWLSDQAWTSYRYSFHAWLLLPNIIPLRCSHAFACVIGSFLKLVHNFHCYEIFYYVKVPQFILSISLLMSTWVTSLELLEMRLLSTPLFTSFGGEGGQKRPPQNVPPHHVGHFELKANKIQQQEKFFASPLTA